MEGIFGEQLTAELMATDLGRSAFIQGKPGVRLMELCGSPKEIRSQLRQLCPRRPGVYGMVDQQGELVYVGMSGRLQDRLLTYFTKGPPEAKEQRVAARARRLMWEVGDHELPVRLRELELIRRWRPRLNSAGRPGRREIGFIYLTPTEAPNLRFSRRPPRASRRQWGPLPLTRRTRQAVKRLNQLFRLRDCSDRVPARFSEQLQILPDDVQPSCLRGAVGTCVAPCSGELSQADYMDCVAAARAFLDGKDRNLIDRYESAMHEAARNRRYEQAAAHRDLWQSLDALWSQLEMVRRAGEDYSGVHVLRGCSGSTLWTLVSQGKVTAVVRAPRARRGAKRCLQLLESAFEPARRAEPEDYEQMRIIVSWYRQHPEQLSAVLDPAEAKELCLESLR